MVDWSSSGPWHVDEVHRFFNSRINLKISYFRNFAKRPLDFFQISPQSTKFQEDPRFSKIIPYIALATSRITNRSL
jgi:hypothetical protein